MKHRTHQKSITYFLRSVGFATRDMADKKLASFGLSNAQGRLLGAIYRDTQNGNSVSRKDLQEEMQISGPSITSLLNGLEKKGWIIRTPGLKDGRLLDLKVTAKTEEFVGQFEKVFNEIQARLEKGLSSAEKKTLIDLLQRLEKNIKG